MGFIYKITSTATPKCYIGQTTKTIEQRWTGHKGSYREYVKKLADPEYVQKHTKRAKQMLYNGMHAHGFDTFKIEHICEVPDEELDQYEIMYIEEYNSLMPNGYNMTKGGSSTYKRNENAVQNADTFRRDESKGLPPCISYRLYNGKPAYYINNHKLCKHKCFLIATYGSMEAAKNAAVEYLKYLTDNDITHEKIKHSGDLPIGLSKIKGGYLVRKRYKKKTYEKRFFLQSLTDEENLNNALKYLAKVVEIINKLKLEQRSETKRKLAPVSTEDTIAHKI